MISSSSAVSAIVEAQLQAFNSHDIDALLQCYSPKCELFAHGGALLAAGEAAIRERFAARFRDKALRAELVERIVSGNFVVDHEVITRTSSEGKLERAELVAMYEVAEGRIAKAWMRPGPMSPVDSKCTTLVDSKCTTPGAA